MTLMTTMMTSITITIQQDEEDGELHIIDNEDEIGDNEETHGNC
jgi:hypothetical protein